MGIMPYNSTHDYLRNIPNKPVEYLSAGLPILSSIAGVTGDLIEKNNCGYVYNSEKELEDILLKLLNNPEELKILAKNAQDTFDNTFHADKVYPKLVQHLEYVVDNYENNI